MTKSYIVIQIIGFIGAILFFVSFQCRNNKTLFRFQFLSYLLYTIHLLLLGATTGGVSYIINAIRAFCLSSSWNFGRSKKMCIIICFMQVAALMLTWVGWISILPVAANVAFTIGAYTYNARTIRLVTMLINSPLWIIYNIIVGTWVGIIDEAVSEISIGISIARYGWKNLGSEQE